MKICSHLLKRPLLLGFLVLVFYPLALFATNTTPKNGIFCLTFPKALKAVFKPDNKRELNKLLNRIQAENIKWELYDVLRQARDYKPSSAEISEWNNFAKKIDEHVKNLNSMPDIKVGLTDNQEFVLEMLAYGFNQELSKGFHSKLPDSKLQKLLSKMNDRSHNVSVKIHKIPAKSSAVEGQNKVRLEVTRKNKYQIDINIQGSDWDLDQEFPDLIHILLDTMTEFYIEDSQANKLYKKEYENIRVTGNPRVMANPLFVFKPTINKNVMESLPNYYQIFFPKMASRLGSAVENSAEKTKEQLFKKIMKQVKKENSEIKAKAGEGTSPTTPNDFGSVRDEIYLRFYSTILEFMGLQFKSFFDSSIGKTAWQEAYHNIDAKIKNTLEYETSWEHKVSHTNKYYWSIGAPEIRISDYGRIEYLTQFLKALMISIEGYIKRIKEMEQQIDFHMDVLAKTINKPLNRRSFRELLAQPESAYQKEAIERQFKNFVAHPDILKILDEEAVLRDNKIVEQLSQFETQLGKWYEEAQSKSFEIDGFPEPDNSW